MVLHNPNNWHWVNKDVSEWARQYLEEHLLVIHADEGGVAAKVTKIMSMDGDVDVNQRKGKVITLFDVKVQLEYEGTNKDGEGAQGTITIPEVAHDTEEDEYVFDIEVYSPNASKEPVKILVRNAIVPQVRKSLQSLAPALIAEHGKDIQHAPGSGPTSGVSTPINRITSSTAAQANAKPNTSTSVSTSQGKAVHVNTSSIKCSTEFRTTAAELFTTFTSAERLTAFTRSAPKPFEGAKPGAKFGLFYGGVSGEYVSFDEPRQIVQKWRLGNWPEGHFSTLTLNFDQDDGNGVTIMRVEWDAIPLGEEDSTQGRWEEYYVRSMKKTFGFGTIL